MLITKLLRTRIGWLAALSLAGLAPAVAQTRPAAGVTLRVQPVFGGDNLVLEGKQYRTAQGEVVTISTCRFYLSSLRLTYADGSTYAEPNSYHLIDAEDEATLALNLAKAPVKAIKTLDFSIGVDSATNVAGAQGGDLEAARGMYWAWHSGYVNAKLEGRSPSCANSRREFEFHIGGFQAPYNSLRRVSLPVPPAAPATPLLVLADVGVWLSAVRLAEKSSVLVPGPSALALADAYGRMFRLKAAQP